MAAAAWMGTAEVASSSSARQKDGLLSYREKGEVWVLESSLPKLTAEKVVT